MKYDRISQSMKPVYCFVMIYVGELKFFERFFSYLSQTYNIHIVVIRPDDDRRRQVIEYAQEHKYSYTVIDYSLAGKPRGFSIPLITPLIKHYLHTKRCQAFLKTLRPEKLLASKTSMPIEPLFKEANYMGIDTLVVQRGHMPPLDSYVYITKLPLLRLAYAKLIMLLSHVVDFLLRGPRYAFSSSSPDRVGAIGEEGKKVLPDRKGYDPKTIEVLGSFEHQWTLELMKKIKDDPRYRTELLKKYGMDSPKKHILVVSSRYYHYIDARISYTKKEEEELVAIFDGVIKTIREVFSPQEATIHFKLHPAEDNIYESYKKYDVAIHGNEAKIDEMVCVSDLFVSYPVTSANYMAVAAHVPAIFINFSPLQELNSVAGDFGITNVVVEQGDFKRLLGDFKKGRLALQYDRSGVNPHSIDNVVKFIQS